MEILIGFALQVAAEVVSSLIVTGLIYVVTRFL